MSAATTPNPLLSDWHTPHGVAPFGQIETVHFLPAFEQALKVHPHLPGVKQRIEQLKKKMSDGNI